MSDSSTEADDPSAATPANAPKVQKWFRPATLQSEVWKYMKHDEKKMLVKCDICPSTFQFKTGGTTTMRRHLKNVHKIDPAKGRIRKTTVSFIFLVFLTFKYFSLLVDTF